MPKRTPLLHLLAPLALATGAALAQPAQPTPQAAQFDAVFEKIVGPDSMDAPIDGYLANIERLRTLIPAGDVARDIRFRSVYCGSDTWKDPKQGLAFTDNAFRLAQAAGDIASQGRALFCRANFTAELHGTRAALDDANQVVSLLENSGEQQLFAEALMQRGSLLSDLGEQANALIDFQRARAAFRAAGIPHEIDSLMFLMAVSYRRMGVREQAERYFTQSVRRSEQKHDWYRLVTDLIQLGYIYDEFGLPQQSSPTFQRAIEVAQAHDGPYGVARARIGLASALINQRQFEPALRLLTLAQAYLDSESNTLEADGILLEGQALAGLGRHHKALSRYAKALPLLEQDGNLRYLATLYQARSASREALGQTAEALADYKEFARRQMELQGKMRLEQGRLLDYEYEIRRRDFENRSLRAEADGRKQQVAALERVRRLQALSLALGGLLLAVLAALAWRQWRKSRALRVMAMTDALTGAVSRRGIDAVADNALLHAMRASHPLSVLMLDIDHFKDINDRYGHAGGDAILRTVTAAWKQQLRGNDRLGRIGGEEFLAVCPDARLEQALAAAARLLEATRALRVAEVDPALEVHVSIGVAEARPGESKDALFARADAALYRAKQGGRNRAEA